MRYLPLTPPERAEMLRAVQADSIDALFRDAPGAPPDLSALPRAQGEIAVTRALEKLAAQNIAAGQTHFFIGAGAYRHHVPASVDHLIQRSEFLTTYTPYQPEIAQGTLQSLFEFQTQVALLTGMDIANASMWDGSTACAEAALMAQRVTKRGTVVISGGVHPHYRATIETTCRAAGVNVIALPAQVVGEAEVCSRLGPDVAAVIVQSPNVFGVVTDLAPITKAVRQAGALTIAAFTECLAFGLIESPGAMGADIVAGEGQSLGNALNFGGPYVGLFAAREAHVRQMPGRLAGETVDADGRRGFVLTLSTREQHIRRDKATSNICTNSGLCALAWSIHMTLLGEKGLRALAQLNHERACDLADALSAVTGVEVLSPRFFNEFAFRTPMDGEALIEQLAKRGVLAGAPFSRLAPRAGLDDVVLTCATELTTDDDIQCFAEALAEVLS